MSRIDVTLKVNITAIEVAKGAQPAMNALTGGSAVGRGRANVLAARQPPASSCGLYLAVATKLCSS
jgi:hypothetical protein